jgi:predicted esterase YcpF (UPF0227 family)
MVVFFHGLESQAGGPKYKFLKDRYGDVYAPSMDYFKNKNLFHQVYEQLKNQKIDIISGSSMGGYFAYWMGKKLGVDTILFNPALPYRTQVEPNIDKSGTKKSYSVIILGSDDDIIKPEDTIEWLESNESPKNYILEWEPYGHRTPIQSFKKYFNKYG